jgi:hypothetical protein
VALPLEHDPEKRILEAGDAWLSAKALICRCNGIGLAVADAACRAGADRMRGIANHIQDPVPLGRDQQLFPHFGETGTTIFAVEKVEYGAHDLTSFV